MKPKYTPPNPARLPDPAAEWSRRSAGDSVAELQSSLAAGMKVIEGVSLPDATPVTVAHGLGRAPKFVAVSVPRGAVSAGYLDESRTGIDRRRYLVIEANGYGATIIVDLIVL